MSSPDLPEFTVDTGLFRQLGELLVGRDSTALIELVKNAYDADATSLILIAEDLANPDLALIRVIDNGSGMTETQFREGFLRLAARSKNGANRRSPIYQRRFTGEKGVGRLAIHKLGALVSVTTVAAQATRSLAQDIRSDQPDTSAAKIVEALAIAPKERLTASIDWDEIEKVESVSAIRDGLTLSAVLGKPNNQLGTTLSISRLRHAWDITDLLELSVQLQNFSPPGALVSKLKKAIVTSPLLFEQPTVRDSGSDDPGMKLELQGDFISSEQFWPDVQKGADWVLEIRASPGRNVAFKMSPTRAGLARNPFSAPVSSEIGHPAPEVGPFFDARIFLRSGPVPTLERAWANQNSGIRVYFEGFRVLPYGESKNDWLGLDSDYTRRAGRFELDPGLGGPTSDLDELRALKSRDVSLRLQPNRNFFGAVFITDAGAGGLKTLVNREGFVPDDAYERVVTIVRTGTDLLHRAWALASLQKKADDTEQQRTKDEQERKDRASSLKESQPDENSQSESADNAADSTEASDRDPANEAVDDSAEGSEEEFADEGPSAGSGTRLLRDLAVVDESLAKLEAQLPPGGWTPTVKDAVRRLQTARLSADDLIADTSLLRVLASVGSQLAAFTHEIAHLVPIARAAEDVLQAREGDRWPVRVVSVRQSVTELRRAIERQAAYLIDVSSSEARRRRSRLPLRERVDLALLAANGAASAREVAMRNGVSELLRTPPMYRAEVQSILSNLMSNALKAVEKGGRVAIEAEESQNSLHIFVSNTGAPVDVKSSERLFLPYVSDSQTPDPALHQGMGLGLPITRQLVEDYGGAVFFDHPRGTFATTVHIEIPN